MLNEISSNNLYQIDYEPYLDEIIECNKFKLITIIFSADMPIMPVNNNRSIKKLLTRYLSKIHTDVIFIYVNLSNFKVTESKYARNITPAMLPLTNFFWNNSLLTYIAKTEAYIIINVIDKLKQKINMLENKLQENQSISQTQQQQQPTNQESPNVIPVKVNPQEILQHEQIPNEQTIGINEINTKPKDEPIKSELDQELIIQNQLRQQQKHEKIEELRKELWINELSKMKKMAEIKEDEKNKNQKSKIQNQIKK